jgi:hypothetical protein
MTDEEFMSVVNEFGARITGGVTTHGWRESVRLGTKGMVITYGLLELTAEEFREILRQALTSTPAAPAGTTTESRP